MPENDQYPQRNAASKKPVTILLTLLLIAGIAVFAYETSDRTPTTTATPTGAADPNPNALVPPGSGARSPTSP